MARVTVEDCLNQVNSRFALVHLAVRRVLQMRKGYPLFVEAPKNKEVVRALREIAAGYVTTDNIRELEGSPEPQEVPIAEVPALDVAPSEEAGSDVDETQADADATQGDMEAESADDSVEKDANPA